MRTKKVKNSKSRVAATAAERLFIEANSAWDCGDLAKAFYLFTKSAELGDSASQIDLGYFFDQGLFVEKDKRKAIHWYYKAYQNGNPSGASNIATVYRDMGNKHKMFWWFRRAAEMGDSDVQLDLARRYESGTELPKSLRMASRFYCQVINNKSATKDEKALARVRAADIQTVFLKGTPTCRSEVSGNGGAS